MTKRTIHVSDQEIYNMYHSGDSRLMKQAKDYAVASHSQFIHYLINRQYPTFETYREDLFQCGVIGLLQALEKYDGQHAFTTCAKIYIVHEMSAFTHHVTKSGSVHYASIDKKIRQSEDLLQKAGETVTIEKISEASGLSLTVVKREYSAKNAMDHSTLDNQVPDTFSIDTVIDKLYAEQLLSYARDLSPEHYTVLYLRVYKEHTFKEIGKILKLDSWKVRRMYIETIKHIKQLTVFN